MELCCRDPGPGIFQCQGSIARVTRTAPRTYHLFEKIAGMVMCNVVKMRHITAVLQNTDKDCRGTAAITLLALSEDPRQLLLAC